MTNAQRLASLFLALTLAPWGPATAEPAHRDLRALVAMAMEQHPGLSGVIEGRREIAGAVVEARADAFPQLDLVASWNRSRNPALLNSPDFEEIVQQFPGFTPGEQELYSVALEATQTVYTGGKVKTALEGARVAGSLVEAEIRQARLDVALAVAEAYYRTLALEKALDTLELQRRARDRALEVVEARFELGDATQLERLRARATRAELEPTVEDLRGQAAMAHRDLESLVGWSETFPLALAEVSKEPPPARERAELLARALERRPELETLDLQARSLELRRRLARADGLPQVELTGAYGRQVRLVENFDEDLYQDWRIALGVRWSFFDGGRRRGRIDQLASQRNQLEWQRRDAERTIALEVEQRLSDYRTALARWRAASLSADAAREASRVARESYQEGAALQADWIAAQDLESRSELSVIEAVFDAWASAARLARAVGDSPERPWSDEGAEVQKKESGR